MKTPRKSVNVNTVPTHTKHSLSLLTQLPILPKPPTPHASPAPSTALAPLLTPTSPALIDSHTNKPLELDAMDIAEWSTIPISFLRAFQQLLHDSSSHQASIFALQNQIQQQDMIMKSFITGAQVQQVLAPMTVMQKELSLLKHKLHTDDTIHTRERIAWQQTSAQHEQIIAKCEAQVQKLERDKKAWKETLEDELKATKRDLQDRGLIMARLSDKLTDELNHISIATKYHCAQVQEMQDRVKTMENRIDNISHVTFSTSLRAVAAGTVSSPSPAPFYSAPSQHTQGPQLALASQMLEPVQNDGGHPLAPILHSHSTPPPSQQLIPSLPSAPSSSSQPAPLHDLPALPAASSQALSIMAPPAALALDQPTLHRYLADYTTRNLQRDLLEIAETYQSTIRNEVDGMRAQLVGMRRVQAEDRQMIQQQYNDLSSEVTHKISAFSHLLHTTSEQVGSAVAGLGDRVRTVEGQCGRTEQAAMARVRQVEEHYQDRNEEVRRWMQQLETGQGNSNETGEQQQAQIMSGAGSSALVPLPPSSAPPSSRTPHSPSAAQAASRGAWNQINYELIQLSREAEMGRREQSTKYERVLHHVHTLDDKLQRIARSLADQLDATYSLLRSHVLDANAHEEIKVQHNVAAVPNVVKEKKYAMEAMGKHGRGKIYQYSPFIYTCTLPILMLIYCMICASIYWTNTFFAWSTFFSGEADCVHSRWCHTCRCSQSG